MNKNPATADQLLELATLQIKRLKEVADQEEVKEAIRSNGHPFWKKFTGAVETLMVKTTETDKLLAFVSPVKLQAVKRFVAAAHFKAGETTDGVKIAWLGTNFKANFLGKVEEEVEACEIRTHTLIRPSRDLGIRSEIGEEREETKLAHLWQLLKFQGNGGKGALLTNGYANIFYVRDTNGVLWAVGACWSGDGWGLHANSVDGPLEWCASLRVCAR